MASPGMTYNPGTMRVLWLAAVTAVVAGSLLPPSAVPIPALFRVSDKLLHFVSYLVLGGLALLSAERRLTRLLAPLSMILLGLSLELLQLFVHRSLERGDMIANAVGAACGATLADILSSRPLSRPAERRPAGSQGPPTP